jgi:hypothetical protein
LELAARVTSSFFPNLLFAYLTCKTVPDYVRAKVSGAKNAAKIKYDIFLYAIFGKRITLMGGTIF